MNRYAPLAIAAALLCSTPAFAQQARTTPEPEVPPVRELDAPRTTPTSAPSYRSAIPGNEPDVLLDVPNLSVDEITLDVENLRAKVSLDAQLANLLHLSAGADVGVDKVNITIKGVKAQLLLKVRLDNVAAIIDRTLTTIDRNPEILEGLLRTVDNTVGTVGGVANNALQPGGVVSQTVGTVGQVANTAVQPGGVISQTVDSLGQTVTRTVDSAGNIVERTLDASGKVIQSRVVGKAQR